MSQVPEYRTKTQGRTFPIRLSHVGAAAGIIFAAWLILCWMTLRPRMSFCYEIGIGYGKGLFQLIEWRYYPESFLDTIEGKKTLLYIDWRLNSVLVQSGALSPPTGVAGQAHFSDGLGGGVHIPNIKDQFIVIDANNYVHSLPLEPGFAKALYDATRNVTNSKDAFAYLLEHGKSLVAATTTAPKP